MVSGFWRAPHEGTPKANVGAGAAVLRLGSHCAGDEEVLVPFADEQVSGLDPPVAAVVRGEDLFHNCRGTDVELAKGKQPNRNVRYGSGMSGSVH